MRLGMNVLRLTLAAALIGIVTVGGLQPSYAGTAPASDGSTSADQQLADRYAPTVMLRKYDGICGDEGEPYVPMVVDPLLDNPEVALRQVGNGDPVIQWAPTAKDLYGRGTGVYLDFAGDSLQPGCIFSDDSARYTSVDQAAVYAHIAREPGYPDYLAVQYFLYWYYNDWNDRHEGDWEFVQVLFNVSSVDEALATTPVSVGYAQHGGGETSDWTSDKLERDGTHPVVYSSEKSHASYFEPALFLGRGASEGFGCDNTQGPSTRVRPRAVLLPDAASGPGDPYAWLAYQGRWGERQGSPNDGPTGPTSKPRWYDPVTWEQDLRPSSFVIPGGTAAAPPIVQTFCSVVGRGSVLFLNFLASPAKVLTGLLVLLLFVAFLLRRTSWKHVPPWPVVARRRAGEIVRASVAVYRQRPIAVLALGTFAIPVGLLAVAITVVLTHLPVVGTAVTVSETDDAGGRLLIGASVSAALWPLTVLLVTAAVSALLAAGNGAANDDASRQHVADAFREVRRRARDLASSFLPIAGIVVVLCLTGIGAPVALWLIVRMQFLPQAVMFEGLGGRSAIAESSRLVRHRWVHTAVISLLVWAVVAVTGAVLGLLLLIAFTGLPIWVVTSVSALCQVILVPLGALVLTLLYGDARADKDGPAVVRAPEPAMA